MLRQIKVRGGILQQIRDLGKATPEQECCGLLAGRDDVVTHVFPAMNVAADPAKNYEIDPREIVGLLRDFREQELDFLGIYHSHPNGKNEPSARDIELAYYSEAIYFIIAPIADAPKPVRAFSIRDGRVAELDIEVL